MDLTHRKFCALITALVLISLIVNINLNNKNNSSIEYPDIKKNTYKTLKNEAQIPGVARVGFPLYPIKPDDHDVSEPALIQYLISISALVILTRIHEARKLLPILPRVRDI